MMCLYLGTLVMLWNLLEDDLEEERGNQSVQVELEAQSNSSSSLPRTAGPFGNKTGAQDAYGLFLRRTTYVWKANFITFPMAPV